MKTISCRIAIISLCLLHLGCQDKPAVKTVRVERGTAEATVSSVNSGSVRAEQIAELAFGAVGRVKTLSVALGDLVKRGQVLAEIENTDLKAALDAAQSEYQRRLQLKSSNAMSQSNLDEAKSLLESTRTNYEKSLIIAPYDGIIAELNVEVGQLSQITAVIPKALFRIIDQEPRYVRAEIDEVDLPSVHEGLPARIRILAVRREPFRGTVRRVVPFISTIREQDRTSEIELTVENEGILLPVGASADIEVIVNTHHDTLTAAPRAVFGRGNDRYVFQVIDGRLRKAAVQIGLLNYDRIEVLNGLSEGQLLALPSEGYELADGLSVITEAN